MPKPNLFLLYVDDTAASVAFYRRLLGREPLRSFPTFASFALEGGHTLGLWAKGGVAPEPAEGGARTEIGFMLPDAGAVEALNGTWKALGLPFAQELTTMDFGPTFVALDPDGHRLRVCLVDD
jgi:catechol 2,3-dioxygenase-like lactoylglutathione lyase family enzyme